MRGKNKYRNDGQKDTYQVRTEDNWFSIAEQIYGDQRMAGLLMEANTGISALHQGQVIYSPPNPPRSLNPDYVFNYTLRYQGMRWGIIAALQIILGSTATILSDGIRDRNYN